MNAVYRPSSHVFSSIKLLKNEFLEPLTLYNGFKLCFNKRHVRLCCIMSNIYNCLLFYSLELRFVNVPCECTTNLCFPGRCLIPVAELQNNMAATNNFILEIVCIGLCKEYCACNHVNLFCLDNFCFLSAKCPSWWTMRWASILNTLNLFISVYFYYCALCV